MAPWSLRGRSDSQPPAVDADAISEPSTPTQQLKKGVRPRYGGAEPQARGAGSGASSSTRTANGRGSTGTGRPPSPTMSARSVGTNASQTTSASRMEWGQGHRGPPVIITRADVRNSLDTYERLLSTAKAYRNAMLALASATSNFASALEDCARQKGAAHPPLRTAPSGPGNPTGLLDEDGHEALSDTDDHGDNTIADPLADCASGEKLMAAAGLHHVMSNQQQLLSDTFYKSFEIPLLEKFDDYKHEVQERSLMYEKETEDKSKRIRDTEAENMRHGRKKQRDLAAFRRALQVLQSQVDDLDRVKADYYHEVLAGEQETWDMVAGRVALVVRAEIDSADRVVTKASSDTMVESMFQSVLDPFNVYGPPKGHEEGQIFSVLAPLSIASPASSASPNHPAHGLARSRTGLSAIGTNTTTTTADDSPATTARWAEEQKKRAANGAGDSNERPRRRGKDQLSWISERDDVSDGSRDEDATPSQERKSFDKTPSSDVEHITMPEEANPTWR